MQDPTHSLLAVVGTEAGDEFHVKIGDPIHDQLRDLVLAPLERDLQVIVPLEGCGLAEEVTEWSHVFCLDETLGNLVDKPEPSTYLSVGLIPSLVILNPVNSTISFANSNFSGEKTIPF